MAVYVDPLVNWGGSATFRWAWSCHMYADTPEELHAFARSIGLRREWFQDRRLPHYDLNASRRAVAVKRGAVEHTRRQAVDLWRDKGWTPKRLARPELDET